MIINYPKFSIININEISKNTYDILIENKNKETMVIKNYFSLSFPSKLSLKEEFIFKIQSAVECNTFEKYKAKFGNEELFVLIYGETISSWRNELRKEFKNFLDESIKYLKFFS